MRPHASAAIIVGGRSVRQVAAMPMVGGAAFAMHEAGIARPREAARLDADRRRTRARDPRPRLT